MPYLTVPQIETRMNTLATTYSSTCTRAALPNATHRGHTMFYLNIRSGSASGKTPVLVTAGVHAREWAPPDAVLNFVENLLRAYSTNTPISYPAFVDAAAAPAITYPAWAIPFPDVKRIVEQLNLFVVPLMNPDGREFTQADPNNFNWRKNRRPHPSGGDCIGVDINRNFDIAWDFEVYYNSGAASTVSASKNPCDVETYIGPAVASEPETRNALTLIGGQNIAFFLDVHSFGRKLLYPWGIEDNQTSNSSMNFRDPSWNRAGAHGGRDGRGGVYREFFPDNAPARLLNRHQLLANRMRSGILATAGGNPTAQSRSTYTVEQSIGLYPTSGAIDDYTFSTQLRSPGSSSVFAFTMECGDASEGGFQPNFVTQYPKIEREVHAALHAFLSYIAATASQQSSGCRCFIATAAFGSEHHPHVQFLRDLRDRIFPSTPFGARLLKIIERAYYSFSPAVAAYMDRHEAARRFTRFTFLSPLVAVLRIAMRLAKPFKAQGAVLPFAVLTLALALAVVCGGLVRLVFKLLFGH